MVVVVVVVVVLVVVLTLPHPLWTAKCIVYYSIQNLIRRCLIAVHTQYVHVQMSTSRDDLRFHTTQPGPGSHD